MATVLIVDDDAGILEGLAYALEADGRSVITCSDIESAQMVVENEQIGCVLCDVRLSGPLSIDGIDFMGTASEVAAVVRAYVDAGVDVPVIFPLPWAEDRWAGLTATLEAAASALAL